MNYRERTYGNSAKMLRVLSSDNPTSQCITDKMSYECYWKVHTLCALKDKAKLFVLRVGIDWIEVELKIKK